jgi:hypothetical protein
MEPVAVLANVGWDTLRLVHHIITDDDLTPEQRAIVEASNRSGTPVPSGLSRDEFTAW